MSWGETLSLARTLIGDMTSRSGAAIQGWQYPLTHEARALMNLFDLTKSVNTDPKKRDQVKPYPRPWPEQDNGTRSRAPEADQETIKAALAARGH